MLPEGLEEGFGFMSKINFQESQIDPLKKILEKYSDNIIYFKEKSKDYDFGQDNLPKKIQVYSAQVNYKTVDNLLMDLGDFKIIGAKDENGVKIIESGDYKLKHDTKNQKEVTTDFQKPFEILLSHYFGLNSYKTNNLPPTSIYIVPINTSDKLIELKFNPLDDNNQDYMNLFKE
jgi:hypothetical protein